MQCVMTESTVIRIQYEVFKIYQNDKRKDHTKKYNVYIP